MKGFLSFSEFQKRSVFESLIKENVWEQDGLNDLFFSERFGLDEEGHQKLDPIIKNKLIKIANDFYDSLETNIPIFDIQFTGSLANYNYTDVPDIDVHIVVDMAKSDDPKMFKELCDAKRWQWNKMHEIFLRGHEIELYIQDINEQHTASGLYSIFYDKWIEYPEPENPKTDPKDVQKKADTIKQEIDLLSTEIDNIQDHQEAENFYNALGEIKSKVVHMRRDILKSGGSVFSVENLAFKDLRNTGYLEKLINLYNEAYDKMFNEQLYESLFTLNVPKQGDEIIDSSGKKIGIVKCMQLNGEVFFEGNEKTLNKRDLKPVGDDIVIRKWKISK